MDTSLLTPLPLPAEMAAWDRAAMDRYGIKNEMLMENASREALNVLRAEAGMLMGKRVLLLAGPGNNGGDALALSRHLLDEGTRVLVLHMAPKARYKGVSRYHMRLAQRVGVPMRKYAPSFDFYRAAPQIIIDGLLGTGFAGELRPAYLDMVRRVNALRDHAMILALDIPSGLNGASGRPQPDAVQAHATVTFGAAKLGLAQPWARAHTGRLHVVNIGIPARVRAELPASCSLLDAGGMRRVLAADPMARFLDARANPEMHKGTSGRVLVAGGSAGMTGAPQLAALGALRAGAGLVTVAAPAELIPRMSGAFPEMMTLGLGQGETWTKAMAGELAARFDTLAALAVGPGLGRDPGAGEFLAGLLKASADVELPRVLDADALWWLARDKNLRTLLRATDVLTPHPTEAARLLNFAAPDTGAVQADRLTTAKALARDLNAVVVLKGAGTVIAGPEGPALLCPIASPCLAVGGTGDILAGATAAMLARWPHALGAAAMAVLAHATAGLLLDKEFPQRGNLAREVALAMPRALKELIHDSDGPRHHDH